MYEMRRHGNAYKIYEKKTQQYISKSKTKTKAASLLKSVREGSGFEGSTPRFLFSQGEIDMDVEIKKVPGYSD